MIQYNHKLLILFSIEDHKTYQSSLTTYTATIGTFNNFKIISDNIKVYHIGNSLTTINSQFKITVGSYI
jgi:hypothetical protein